jgi:hypothetical protein
MSEFYVVKFDDGKVDTIAVQEGDSLVGNDAAWPIAGPYETEKEADAFIDTWHPAGRLN